MNQEILQEDVRQFAEHFELGEQCRGKSFLITGATGLIGSVLIKCLIELNRQKDLDVRIVAIVRSLEKAKDIFADDYDKVDFRKMALTDIKKESIDCPIDYVVHLASPTSSRFFVDHPVETLRAALEGTSTVLDYSKQAEVKGMVYASSLEVYGSNHTDEWIKEDFQGYVNPTEVRSSYNLGKRACECLCHSYAKEYGVNVMIARFTQVFGAGISAQENRVFAQFARKAIEGENIELHTTGESSKPYCYTTDAINALMFLLFKGKKGEAYNIANKNSYISIRDMAQMIRNEFNPQIEVVIVPKENQGYAPQTMLRLNTDKLVSLGWEPRYGLRQMFDRLIKYLKS